MVWNNDWREETWRELDREWDLIIIGGGITGAGVFRQAVLAGLKTLLVEGSDFGSGTSSRSSKLVHGGLRYLKTAQIGLTLESVREREYLLNQGRGLVTRLGFLYARQKDDHMPGWMFGLGLCAYDLMARQWQHRSYDALDMLAFCPHLNPATILGGYRYFDAQTDDARLVLRLLRESVEMGGLALNYAKVTDLLRTRDGRVCGISLQDASGIAAHSLEVKSKIVINATGVWVDELRSKINRPGRMRPLRGSHLVFSSDQLPITRAVTFLHPQDGRPVFALPWEGVVIFGTTDIDHKSRLVTDPSISSSEFDYLLSSLKQLFPVLDLSRQHVISTFSGLRPVVNTGKKDPSKESREYAIWDENGLITVAGGKLTTFRLMARDTIKRVSKYLMIPGFNHKSPTLISQPEEILDLPLTTHYTPPQHLRLLGRYNAQMLSRLAADEASTHEQIPGTPYSWAELKQIARSEAVIHLDDLLLRRLRIGLQVKDGGDALMDRIGKITRSELGWSNTRWEEELMAYRELIKKSYQPH